MSGKKRRDVEQALFTTFEEDGIYHIQCSGLVPGPGHVYATLVVGTERAFLFDNGFGEDDIGEYVKTLTDKPIMAAASHVHADHIGGMEQFPDLWLHKSEIGAAIKLFPELPYDEERMVLGSTQLHGLEGNEKIELGGRSIQLIHTPGHTAGSICAYDSKTRIMLTGDTLSRRVFLFTAVPPIPFVTYRKSLEKLFEFDIKGLLPGHDLGLVPREWLQKMIGMLDSFTPEKGREYDRPEFGDSLMLYTVGKGYGDPEYFGFGYCAKELEILMSK